MQSRSPLVAPLLAIAAAASTLTWSPEALRLPGRSGFLLAGMILAAVVAYVLVTDRWWLVDSLRAHRRLCLGLAAVSLSRLASCIGAQDQGVALSQSIRSIAVLVFFLLVFLENGRDTRLQRSLSIAAAIVIALHAGFFVLGASSDSLLPYLFETGTHLHLGRLPRFSGVTGGPFACGFTMIACTGLVRALPWPKLRTVATAAGIALSVMTFSFASLVLPVALSWRLAKPAIMRWSLTAATAVCALAILYVHPLEIRTDGQRHRITDLHPDYFQEGLGPRHMPIKSLRTADIELRFHFTGYYYLARRSLRCFADHPVLGVGGRNHPYACPVRTMNSLGRWPSSRIAHNEYTGLLAEYGLAGLAATALLLLVMAKGYRFSPADRWVSGAIAAYLISGLAGEVWYQFPLAALIGMSLAPPGEGDPKP